MPHCSAFLINLSFFQIYLLILHIQANVLKALTDNQMLFIEKSFWEIQIYLLCSGLLILHLNYNINNIWIISF